MLKYIKIEPLAFAGVLLLLTGLSAAPIFASNVNVCLLGEGAIYLPKVQDQVPYQSSTAYIQ